MKAVFSTSFKTDLVRYEEKYKETSERLSSAFRARVKSQTGEIIKWEGGDHRGPHGFPCRRTKPFPFYIYYQVVADTIYFIGLVHEKRHPDFLKERLKLK